MRLEAFGAGRTRASHTVSLSHETLGAESIRAHESLYVERIRASHMVSKCYKTLGIEHIYASHRIRGARASCHDGGVSSYEPAQGYLLSALIVLRAMSARGLD